MRGRKGMFKFDLQAVLDYRTNLEENCLVAYSEQQRHVEDERRLLQAMKDKRAELTEQFVQKQNDQATADEIGMYVSYIRRMIAKEQQQVRVIVREEDVLEKKRGELLEAMKNRKALENLKEKKLQQFKAEALEKERKELDEFGIKRFQGKVHDEKNDHSL